jgi:3-oxoacyl-[acyl-carrier protein] reductase
MPTLTGKTALVTGASRGMGRASALALAAAGAQVLVHYSRGAKEADGVVAGISKAATIEETMIEDFDRTVRSQRSGAVLSCAAAASDHVERKQHRFPLVARRACRCRHEPGVCSNQGAIDTLVKHFAAQLGARGIRVNAVTPGIVNTDMSNFTKTEAGRDIALGVQALKRLAQPGDIGGVIAFLASEDARWITGDTIRVDGGSKL